MSALPQTAPLPIATSSQSIPFGPLGFITYRRSYSRKLDENNPESPYEEFPQTIDRVLEAARTQLFVGFTDEEEAEARRLFLDLKCSVAGRFLWQLGTKTVERLGLLSLQNCAAIVIDEPVKPFLWLFDALMLGCGVGVNVQKENVYKLPKVKDDVTVTRMDTNDADFIVPDSREGWIELLRRTLEAYFVDGKSFSYSTICVRGKGAPIKKFGGVASGPEELCAGIEAIGGVLANRGGKNLRPVDAMDIADLIGQIVVSGNVRRAAIIIVGDPDDLQYLNAKRWDLGAIPNWRAMSNNSVVCNDFKYLPDQFWKGYTGNGEPYGLINMKLARSTGRLGDTQYKDRDIIGVNPCAEQFLENGETCCLAEIFLPRIESYDELLSAVKTVYRINKHALALKCHQKITEKVVHKNMRMGIGVTGYLQATEEQKAWLPDAYKALRAYDESYSKAHGFPKSIKLTTVKPSGSLSLLPHVTPGVHPGFARFFIRRIRIAANSPLIELCKKNGYPVEYQRNNDGTPDLNTQIVSFPCSFPEHTVLAKDMTAVQQLEYVKRLQTDWSDNAVSCTVYYRPEELPAIKEWLTANYNASIKSVSFLLHSEHGFDQAPYEEISEEDFKSLSKKVKPIRSGQFDGDAAESADECVSGACPIR